MSCFCGIQGDPEGKPFWEILGGQKRETQPNGQKVVFGATTHVRSGCIDVFLVNKLEGDALAPGGSNLPLPLMYILSAGIHVQPLSR